MDQVQVFADDETIVRVLRTPHFYKRGAITPAAFRPQRTHFKLSTIRWLDRECPDEKVKAQCHSIGNSGSNTYWGVAGLTAGDFISLGLMLEYSPEEYPGHTDVVFPVATPSVDEPLEGDSFVIQSEIANALIARAKAIVDPDPQSAVWTIPETELPLGRRAG